MVFDTRVVLKRKREHHKTLNVGSMFYITETRAPLGRVYGYYFGSATKPDYIVKLDSEIQLPDKTPVSFVEKFAEYIDEDDLYKRFHDQTKKGFDFFEEEEGVSECESKTTKRRTTSEEENSSSRKKRVLGMTSNHYDSHAPQLQHQHFRSSQSSEPNRGAQGSTGQSSFNPFCMQQQPCPNAAAPMMYQPEEQFTRPTNHQNQIFPNLFMRRETYQPNQMGFDPNLVPSEAPMMYKQQQHFRSSQIKEPSRGAQGSTMFAGHKYFNQPFGMQQQSMRPDTNQQNQMGIISSQALTMINAELMMNLQQFLSGQISTILQGGRSGSFGVDLNYSNQEHFGFPQPRPELNLNPQTQPMQSQVFCAGPSSYRTRGHGRRGRGRRGRGD